MGFIFRAKRLDIASSGELWISGELAQRSREQKRPALSQRQSIGSFQGRSGSTVVRSRLHVWRAPDPVIVVAPLEAWSYL